MKVSSNWGLHPWRRHSLMLMVAGFVYIGVGLAYALTEPTAARMEALVIAERWMSLEEWGDVFIVAGVLAFISARWPQFADTWGYMVLTGLSAGWSAFYVLGMVLEKTSTSNISISLVWGLLAFMWWFISGVVAPIKSTVISDGPP